MMLESPRSSIWSGVRVCGVLLVAVAAFVLLSALVLAEDRVAGAPTLGGAIGPGGVEVTCDLPTALRMRNTGGMGADGPGTGAGLCVFTSVEHAGRWQNESRLVGLQKHMTREEGGGYPDKLDRMLKKYSPGVRYVQHTGGDVEFLRAAIRGGRMPGVTYAGHDPHYGATTIAHMVNLVHLDDKTAAILDNNYPGEDQIVWMTAQEFTDRWKGEKDGRPLMIRSGLGQQPVGGGWAVVVLNPPPPPVPSN